MPSRLSSRTNGFSAGCGENPPRKAQPADDGAPVGFLGQIPRVDRRRLARPVRLGLDIAARQGPHLPGAGAQPGVSSSSPIWPFLKLTGAKVHCGSGVADSSSTLAEAATIEGL